LFLSIVPFPTEFERRCNCTAWPNYIPGNGSKPRGMFQFRMTSHWDDIPGMFEVIYVKGGYQT
jgi:hypothetical protein